MSLWKLKLKVGDQKTPRPDNNGELSPKQRLQGENGELSHKNGMIDDYRTYSGDTVELDINSNMI